MTTMNILAVGASKNIGYHAALRFLGHSVTFVLRSPSVFDADEKIQTHVKAGRATLVKGDALVREDLVNAWTVASEQRPVDLVVFTVGAIGSFSLTKGVVLSPPDLCTRSLLNVIVSAPPSASFNAIIISSTGLTHESYTNLPLSLQALYAYAIRSPLRDKVGMEVVMAQAGGPAYVGKAPSAEVLSPDGAWKGELQAKSGAVRGVVVVRPAMLTDGKCKGVYRTSEGDKGKGFTTISRQDVGHFLVEGVVKDWAKWDGKVVSLAY